MLAIRTSQEIESRLQQLAQKTWPRSYKMTAIKLRK